MSQTQSNFSNMYPLPIELNEDKFKNILATLSVGDSKHDFHYNMETLTSKGFKDAFNYGLPDNGGYNDDNIMDEEKCLSSVIRNYTDKSGEYTNEYVPINVSNPKYITGTSSEHQITTINGKQFTVSYTDVKPKTTVFGFGIPGKEITADIFYKNLGLNNYQNIAIVVDAASIGLFEILSSGTKLDKNVYYIYGPEVINDPATKKTPDSKVFKNGSVVGKIASNGVNLISCVPLIKNGELKFNYNFNPNESSLISTPYLNQFYTKYNFILSDVKETIKGKSMEYITNLDIKGAGSEINTLPNSKSKNDITYLENILKKFISYFSPRPGNLTTDKKFLISSSLQQKRSGDWLQVLLCAALKDKIREFKEFNGGDENVVANIQEVFFVTHDRIALAFALLNGINCIFTHHNGQQRFHSAFAFKLNDPVRQAEANLQISMNYQSQLENLTRRVRELREQILTYINNIYDIKINRINFELRDGILSTIRRENTTPYNASLFVSDTIFFFTKALEIIFSKSLYPDLRRQKIELDNLDTTMNQLLSGTPEIVIKNYRYITSTIENIQSIFNKANSVNEKDYNNKLSDFKKSHIYKLAAKWTWDVNINSREIANLSNPENGANYNLDRNMFLYNLNELDNDIKELLSFAYYQIYNKLYDLFMITTPANLNDNFKNGASGAFTERGFIKFKAVSLPFCIEVLLTLGGGEGLKAEGKAGISHVNITKLLDDFLKLNNEKITNFLITDGIVVKEDNNYNISSEKGTTNSEDIVIVPIIDSNVSVTDTQQLGGDHIVGGSFEMTIKQVTYPLMTFILFSGNYSTQLQNYIGDMLYPTITEEPSAKKRRLTTSIEPPIQEQLFEEKNIPFKELSAITPSTVVPSQPQPQSTMTIGPRRGGGINSKLVELYESLPPLSENEKSISTFANSNDVFKDNSICFHPLLPVYMLTQSYMNSINNESIEESLDFDLFVNYLKFLKKIKENVVKIYSTENNNEKKLEAYIIGFCLKQLLFVSNNDDSSYQDCLNVLGTDNSVYSKVSSYTESLVHMISGSITHDDIVLQQGPIYLNSELFKDFCRGIDINSIFTDYADYNSFNQDAFIRDVLQFSVEVAEQIMSDRGIISETVVLSIDKPSGIPGFTVKERAEAAARGNILAQQKIAESKIEQKPRIVYGSEFFKQGKEQPGDVLVKSTTSSSQSSSSRRGGKKQKKTRRPNKTHKNKTKTKKHVRKHKKTRRVKK